MKTLCFLAKVSQVNAKQKKSELEKAEKLNLNKNINQLRNSKNELKSFLKQLDTSEISLNKFVINNGKSESYINKRNIITSPTPQKSFTDCSYDQLNSFSNELSTTILDNTMNRTELRSRYGVSLTSF